MFGTYVRNRTVAFPWALGGRGTVVCAGIAPRGHHEIVAAGAVVTPAVNPGR